MARRRRGSGRVSKGVCWGAGSFFCCAAAAALVVAVEADPGRPTGVVRENVTLSGVPLAGKSREEVKEVALELAARLLAVPVTLRCEKRTTPTTPGKLGAKVEVEKAVEAAFDRSLEPANFLEQLRNVIAGPPKVDIPLPLALTEEGVRKGLLKFSVRVGPQPKNARLTKVGGQFKSFPPKPGRELDYVAVVQNAQAALDAADLRARLASSLETEPSRGKWLTAQTPLAINAPTREAQPRITLEHLEPITTVLSTFSTGLGGSSRNRVHNIQLAAKAIDGTVLLPGDVFSYNETVGPRVPSAGYREAPVIVQGRLQPGTGGGICQVSSTMYNAALLADLQIVRRSHHAFPVHYVPPGRDATVVDGAIDFKFKNRLEHPIALDAKVAGRRVVFSVYGHPDDRRQVSIVSSGVSTVPASVRTVSDPRLPRGRRVVEKGVQPGRRVTISRIVKKDGQVLRREVVVRDYYRPIGGIVRVGTRAPIRRAPAAQLTGGRGRAPEPPASPSRVQQPAPAPGEPQL